MGRRDDTDTETGTDDLDDLLLRRRARQRADAHRFRVYAGIGAGVGLLVLVVAGVGIALAARGSGPDRAADAGGGGAVPGPGAVQGPGLLGPSPTSEGTTWSHDDLLAYLNSKGMTDLGMGTTHVGQMGGPVAVFAPDGTEYSDSRGMDLTKVVYCQKLKTVQEAKDRAGAAGPDSFAWGCFYFKTQNHQLKSGIKRALGID